MGFAGRPMANRLGLVTSMIDTDPSRWRRSLRPASTMTALALLTIAIAVAISGCGSAQTSTGSAHTMTVVVRTTSTASTTHADVAARKHRPTAPAAPSFKPTGVAVVKRPVAERSAPGGRGHVLGTIATHTEFGSVTAVPIVRRSGA